MYRRICLWRCLEDCEGELFEFRSLRLVFVALVEDIKIRISGEKKEGYIVLIILRSYEINLEIF